MGINLIRTTGTSPTGTSGPNLRRRWGTANDRAYLDRRGGGAFHRPFVVLAPIVMAVRSLFAVVRTMSIGAPWQIVPAGVLAGTMSSVEASKAHDRESEVG